MLLILIICVVAVQASHFKKETNLVFLQIISRHGDRAPIFKYPNDPNADYVWHEGMGKLTNLGKKQHFMLGKHIRSMYKNFITSDPNEVNATSSESDRCIRSAQAHLAGLYEPDPKWVFHESLKWQPIPVTYTPNKEDKILSLSYNCPQAKEVMRKSYQPIHEEIIIKYKEMFESLTISSGVNLTNLNPKSLYANILYFFDTIYVQKAHNLVLPNWAEFYFKDLEKIIDRSFSALHSSPIFHRLRAGHFIEKLANVMTNKINRYLPQQKVQLYNTHDLVLGTLLSALDIYNGRRTPYSSTLLVELHKDFENEHFVRFLYLNSSTPELGEQESHVLKLKGCSEFCPFDYFKNFIKNKIPVDIDDECKTSE